MSALGLREFGMEFESSSLCVYFDCDPRHPLTPLCPVYHLSLLPLKPPIYFSTETYVRPESPRAETLNPKPLNPKP